MPYSNPVDADRAFCGRNMFAAFLLLGAAGILHANFDPLPVGTDSVKVVPFPPVTTAALTPGLSARPPGLCPGRVKIGAKPAGLVDSEPPASVEWLSGKYAVLLNILLLEKGARDLAEVSDYTATLTRQEATNGVLGEPEVIFMKLRHKPFSVYLKWLQGDVGREVLYVEGQNDGNMLVRLGGLKGRLLPALKIDPLGERAMAASRNPITEAGLLRLSERLANYRRQHLGKKGVHCRMEEQVLDSRPCYCFTLEFDDPAAHDGFCKSIQYIDKELSLPVCVQSYGWPEGWEGPRNWDEAPLLECYRYSDIRLNQQLADSDFDRSNREYRFRR